MSSFAPTLQPGHAINGEAPIEFMEAPVHPDVLALLGYWNDLRRGRPMPDRSDIRPEGLVRFLPSLAIVETIDGGSDFRFRLFGTVLAEYTGVDRTGERFSQLEKAPGSPLSTEETRERWISIARTAFALTRPVFFKLRRAGTDRAAPELHGIVLPLSTGAADIGQVIGGAFVLNTPKC